MQFRPLIIVHLYVPLELTNNLSDFLLKQLMIFANLSSIKWQNNYNRSCSEFEI